MKRGAGALCGLLLAARSWAGEPKPDVASVVARHLESIGSPQAREAARSRRAEGAARLRILVGGTGELTGRAVLFSEARDVRAVLRFAARDYTGESFGYVKDHVDIGRVRAGVRSEVGQFFFTHDEALRDGLLSGALSTAWPLYAPDRRGAKLKYDGLKKVEGVLLHQVSYGFARRRSSLEVRLFFEPESFRHLRTTYRVRVPPPMVTSTGQSSQQQESVYEAQEIFAAFETQAGLTLPREWTLTFAVGGE